MNAITVLAVLPLPLREGVGGRARFVRPGSSP
jgi:hypothetical protein